MSLISWWTGLSTAGKLATAAGTAAAVGTVIAVSKNSAAATAATPTPAGPVTPPPAGATGPAAPGVTPPVIASILFNLTTPYTALAGITAVQTDLANAGFANAIVQPDLSVATANGWIVAANYSSAGPNAAAIAGALQVPSQTVTIPATVLPPATGNTATISNVVAITSIPAVTTLTLATGTWYQFSVITSFLQSQAPSSTVLQILQTMGFGITPLTSIYITPITQSSAGVPIPASTPQALDTWNVIAEFSGVAAVAALVAAGTSQLVSDVPPLLMFKPGTLTALGTTAPANPTPSNVMP